MNDIKLKFKCDTWECRKDEDSGAFIFETDNWHTSSHKDDPHDENYIIIDARCPRCYRYSHKYITLETTVRTLINKKIITL